MLTPYSAGVNLMVYSGTRHQLRKRPMILLRPYMAVSFINDFIEPISYVYASRLSKSPGISSADILTPKCLKAFGVTSRPRGVRLTKPSCIK